MRCNFTPPPAGDPLHLRRQVALSFPLAFIAHDLEEMFAARWWEHHGRAALGRRFPGAPVRLLELAVPTAGQMSIAIGVVGAGVATATLCALAELSAAQRAARAQAVAVPGLVEMSSRKLAEPTTQSVRDLGEVRLLQAALAAYTAHGLSHLGAAAVVRGYVPGVVTTPLVILPYSVWAWKTLRATGLPRDLPTLVRHAGIGTVLTFALIMSGHLVGRALRPAR